jgi:hypothetical protein
MLRHVVYASLLHCGVETAKFFSKRAARISTEPAEIISVSRVEVLNQNRQQAWFIPETTGCSGVSQ